MLKAMGARGVTTLTSAVFGILVARMILGETSREIFALYALVMALPSLLQFQDLGAGAALVNVIATSNDPRDPRVRLTLLSVWRVTLLTSTSVLVVNVIMWLTGGWIILLGDLGTMEGAPIAAFTALCMWAATIPFSVWLRILLGLRRNHLSILIQGLVAPLNFLIVWLMLLAPPAIYPYLALSTYTAGLIVALVGMTTATRAQPAEVAWAARRLLQTRKHPGTRVMDVGWPMLAQMVSAPLAVAAQRYVLAQYSEHAVAEYAAAAQVFFAFMGVIMAAGIALWPQFSRERALGEISRGPFPLSATMAVGSTVLCLGVFVTREPLFAFTTMGVIEVTNETVASFTLLVLLQAVLYPLGMFIMDKPGIRFQVIPTLMMAVSSFVLALAVTPHLGIVGPILSNCACVLVFQIIPFTWYILRHRDRLWART